MRTSIISLPSTVRERRAHRYKIGEAFIHMPHSRAVKRLERDLSSLNDELAKYTSNAEECEKTMKELKVTLYAKFGRAINLDE